MKWESPLLSWKGRTVHQPSDSAPKANEKVLAWAQNLGNRLHGSLFFVPSPLEGWGVEALLQVVPADSVVVFLEKDEELASWSRQEVQRLTAASVRKAGFHWLEADSEAAVVKLMDDLPLLRLRRCEWLPLNGGWLLHSNRYREVFARLQTGIATFWSNRMTSLHMGSLWVRNLFDNLTDPQFRSPPWPDWGDAAVLVCGAGTTLELWKDHLVKNRASWKILVADTALPVLLAWEVVPDGVVCLEAQQVNLRDFLPAAGKPIDLFTDLSCHPATTRALSGRTFWFSTPFENLSLWDRLTEAQATVRIPPVGSVGAVAVLIAQRLSRGNIYLAGLDFSWPRGQSHAKSTPVHTALLQTTSRFRGMEQVGTWPSEGVLPVAESGFWTTNILKGYGAALAQAARSSARRTFVLGTKGLNLGLPTQVAWPEVASAHKTAEPAPIAVFATNAINSFPQQELLGLERLLEAFRALNLHPQDEQVWLTLENLLRLHDHLFFHFPDPEIRRESAFLTRALVMARWLHQRLSARLNPR